MGRLRRNPWWRPAVVGNTLIVVIALWLGWTIIANTAADTRAQFEPQAALAWRSNLPTALVKLAEQRLLANDPPVDTAEVQRLAASALTEGPLEARSLRLLALVAELAGDIDEADALMELAAGRSRRDPLVQVWLFNRRARLADFDAALGHADALLRSRPYLQDRILPTLIAFAIDPEAKDSLVRFLAQNPPWRSWYLREVSRQVSDPGITFAMLADLLASANPPTDVELRPYVQDLVDGGRFEQAYLAWLHFLPDERKHSIKYVYNGDFEFPLSGLPFDWSIGRVNGASTDIVARSDENGGSALRVEFANRRVAYRHVAKLTMLPPGSYRLTGEAKAEDLRNERGLVWRIACAEADKQVLTETPPVIGTVPWQRFEKSFDVPHSGCRAQWLTLLLPARVALEEQIGGEVWFDNLAVERIDRTAAATAR